MGHTITFPLGRRLENFGSLKAVVARVNITTYTNGGEVFTAAEFNMRAIGTIFASSSENGYIAVWDQSSKIIVMYYDYDAGADGVAITADAVNDVGEFDFLVLGTD